LIVDTSALVAIVLGEAGWEKMSLAVLSSASAIPAPVITELVLVTGSRTPAIRSAARGLIDAFTLKGCEFPAFERGHADLSMRARDLYGRGNGRGGKLNFGDLMVYAIAKERGEPLLCTGGDFATTDLEIHPASRLDL
jgi:ribonuclease VapC